LFSELDPYSKFRGKKNKKKKTELEKTYPEHREAYKSMNLDEKLKHF
jgi:hypothetical protein